MGLEFRTPNGMLHNTDRLPAWAQEFIKSLQMRIGTLQSHLDDLQNARPESPVFYEQLPINSGENAKRIYLPSDYAIKFKVGGDVFQVRVNKVSNERETLLISTERDAVRVIPWATNTVNLYTERL